MDNLHTLLRRQLKRHLGTEVPVPEGCRALLEAVNAAYFELDSGRHLLERALDLSSRELFQANSELRGVLKALPDRLLRIGADGHIVDLTGAALPPPWLAWDSAAGETGDGGGEASAAQFHEAVRAVRGTKAAAVFDYADHSGGPERTFEARLLPFVGQDIVAIVRDITEQQAAAEALRRQQAFLRNVIDTDPNFIFVKDEAGRFLLANRAVAAAYDTTPEGLLGRCDADFNANSGEVAQFRRDDQAVLDGLEAALEYEETITDAQGHRRWLQTVKRPIYSPDSPGRHVLGICTDITARKQTEAQLAHQAFHDALTGLPNRALFMERVGHALARACRAQTPLAVLFLDLDNFKLINDSLGHDAGDALLRGVAARLLAGVRPGDTVARQGGDEFTILLDGVEAVDDAVRVAERIMDGLRLPIAVGSREVFTSGSLGMVISRGECQTPDELLRDADAAMYEAKSGGKGGHALFDRTMNSRAVERLDLETGLRRALDRGELRVHYQPILSLDGGELQGVEALVRWEHPERGLVPPGKFVPLAEETGMIVPLGRWVLHEACRQVREWQRSAGVPSLSVSVNLSLRQLQQPDLVEQVRQVLAETGLPAARLKLEITESVMMEDAESTIPKLYALKALGIRLAVDDFGTGYSSMAYLSSLPIDTLKIDRSFVTKINGHDDHAIVRAIIGLAKMLGLRVTGEGIETCEQWSQLRALGCDQGQGYYFSPPVSGPEFKTFLASRVPPLPLAA